jgi:hypothetical protein
MDNKISNPGFCEALTPEMKQNLYNLFLSFIITIVFCLSFYKYLKNRTIYIEKFTQNEKVIYNIDGTDFNVKK